MAKTIKISQENFEKYARGIFTCLMPSELSKVLEIIQTTCTEEPHALLFKRRDGMIFLLEEGEQEAFSKWSFSKPGDENYGTFHLIPKHILKGDGNVAS